MAGAGPVGRVCRCTQTPAPGNGHAGLRQPLPGSAGGDEIFDPSTRRRSASELAKCVVSIHCGSRGLGHQIGTEFLREMVLRRSLWHHLPDRELACAPINSELGQRYLGAMRAGINCALANRQIIGT